ncbi:Gfo/Idh/MocA family protein [Actinoallomurus sp. CA-150999]|uniref:Gfo/Idh/MocA family protein n=1 Tax=Actinoallomurus sp. CA-150999 TaxID=3239887 RepID=UPI003D8B66C5
MDRIRVGVIGASPDRGWAATAHIPALRALPEFELTAVGTSRPESAQEAARVFGAPHAFTDARRLAEHPEVDLVVVTVKVSTHAELVGAALAAGKHVYCEWPLGLTTEEAEHLAASARTAGVHDAIGLQARYAPAVSHARRLIAEGYVGRVTSVHVHAVRGKGAAGEIPAWAAYTLDGAQGAGLLEVVGGHTLDVLECLAGDFAELSAALAVQRTGYTVTETGDAVTSTSPDQVLLHGVLTGGAMASVHLEDARVGDNRTVLEIAGTEGDLTVVAAGDWKSAQIQISEPRLRGTREVGTPYQDLPVPEHHRSVPAEIPAAARNVARVYAALADDLRDGSRSVAGFDHGVRLHRLLDAIRESTEKRATHPVTR